MASWLMCELAGGVCFDDASQGVCLQSLLVLKFCYLYHNIKYRCVKYVSDWYNEFMESEPDYSNVHFIDEYPHLEEKLRIKRLCQRRMGETVVPRLVIMPFPINYREIMEQGPNET